jgi:phosphonatase-like hydrolase
MANTPALVVFDLSGTTVEDRGQVPEAFAAAFQRAGMSVTPDELRAVRGATKRQAIFSLMPAVDDRAARADRVYAAFREDLSARYSKGGVQPIKGASETFAWLRDRQIRFALTTGFDREITQLLLATLRWEDIADAVVCGDDVAHGRPAPDLIRSAMARTGIEDVRLVAAVGDTALDLRAGWNAGVRWNIGVLSGAHDRQTLAAEPQTHILTSVASLPALWSADPM